MTPSSKQPITGIHPKHIRSLNTNHWPLLFSHWPLLIVCFLILGSKAYADTPSVNYIFPAGGQRGTSVAIHVGGHNLHEVCPFEMIGPGVEATPQLHRAPKTIWFEGPRIPMPASQGAETYPKDQAGAVTIAHDAELGLRRFRVWTSQGVIPSMRFVIGNLPEIVEQEIDGLPIPTPVTVPVTINGRIFPREDIDIWTVQARAGKTYTCEVLAARIGSALDSHLEVIGPDGRQVAENIDSRGADSFIQFKAPIDGEYQVRISDINFGGLQHYVYRLTINDGPYVNHVYPLGGRKGSRVSFEMTGANTPPEPVALHLAGNEGETIKQRFLINGVESNEVTLELSDDEEHLEREPNNDVSHVSALAVPAIFNGRIDRAGDVDYWQFRAKKGEEYICDLRAARLNSLLDSVLTLRDAEGKVISENDDMAGGQSDSKITFTAPADGVYTLVVREAAPRRGGPEFAYRLAVSPPPQPESPDFELRLPTDALTLNRGQEVKFKVQASRRGGFEGPITLQLADLPSDVSVSELVIPEKKNEIELTFKAEKTAQVRPVHLTVSGSAKIGEVTVTRRATTSEEPRVDHLLLAVSMPTPFQVKGIFETKYADRGATYFRQLRLERNGFEGPITVKFAEQQIRHLQGVTGGEVLVPPGETVFNYPIKLAPWMQPARTSRSIVMAVADVTDEQGKKHKVSYTSGEQADQIIVLVTTGNLSVDLTPKSVFAQAGKTIPLKIQIGRGKNMAGPVRVRLDVPEHIHGITAQDVVIPPGETEVTMHLNFADGEIGPFNMPLKVLALAKRDGHPYTAEGKIDVITEQSAVLK